MNIYLVGGAVRDQLLGRPVHERDWVVVGAVPAQLEALGYRRVDPQFPVYLHPQTGEEYALARREAKTGQGYKGFSFDCSASVSLEEDLARRDLTINAMAMADDDTLIDPWAGREDLQRRTLRHVTPAFVEDPLRALRLARFAAELGEYNFSIEPSTQELARHICQSGELRTLSAGRIWRETARALACPSPAVFFTTLRHWKAVNQLLPWLSYPEATALEQHLEALARVSAQTTNADVRLATLLVGAALDGEAIKPLPASARTLAHLCKGHPLPINADAQTVFNWLQAVDAWRRVERFEQLLLMHHALDPQTTQAIGLMRRCRDASQRVPPPPAGVNPRDAVRSSRLAQIAKAMQ